MKKLWKTDEELCIHKWLPSGHLSSGHLSSGHQVVTILDPEMES